MVTISIGDAQEAVMDAMASEPSNIYSRAAESVQSLIDQVAELRSTFCTEVHRSCYMSNDCRDDVKVAIHGSGFIDRGDNNLQCRISGIGNGPETPIVVNAVPIGTTDDEKRSTLTCDSQASVNVDVYGTMDPQPARTVDCAAHSRADFQPWSGSAHRPGSHFHRGGHHRWRKLLDDGRQLLDGRHSV